jgi:hypothetical protein
MISMISKSTKVICCKQEKYFLTEFREDNLHVVSLVLSNSTNDILAS